MLQETLAGLAQRRAGALEVLGEPGIGKTRLLAELGADADARGMIVLSGSASELEHGLPFWVLVDALDDYVHGLDPRRLQGLDAESHAELPHVLPSLAEGARNGMIEAARELVLRECSSTSGLVAATDSSSPQTARCVR